MQCDLIDRDCAWWFCGNLEHVKKVLIKKKEAAEKKQLHLNKENHFHKDMYK